jgi:hypothetical protein
MMYYGPVNLPLILNVIYVLIIRIAARMNSVVKLIENLSPSLTQK